MTTNTPYRLLATLVTLSLVLTTSAGAEAPNTGPLSVRQTGTDSALVATPEATPTASAGETSEEEPGGWFSNTIDRAGDIANDVKDTTVDTAEASWEVVKEAPGAVWNVVEDVPSTVWDFVAQIPGTIARLWQPVWEFLTTRVEIPGLAEFLADHPLIRTLLVPLLFLFGIAYDGTMSFLDAGLVSLALLLPLIKTGPYLITGIQKLLPWTSESRTVVSTIVRNPGGIISGVHNAIRLSRARSIAPTVSSIQALPHSPGVYIALDASGTPLYVGMSNSLNRRLSQHFITGQSRFAERTSTIKVLPTESPTAARILECSLIKQLHPKDNILLAGRGPCPIFLPPSPKVFVMP